MPILSPGVSAPEFELPNQNGARVSLVSLRGHFAVLWWYPKADTPG
ncbi:MAG: redoxin domain-containing protein [Chromatiales bacterium]|jgi:thioredoxin-dependent peroxiredoxin|nr:redoxin domain-containing protein [Chromatiales bacterium]